MFEESLLESAHLLRIRSRWPAVASFATQAALVATIITVPLLHPGILPLRAPALTLTPPVPTPPKPPPPRRVHVETSISSAAPATPTTSQFTPILPALDPNRFGDTPPTVGNINMIGNDPGPASAMSSSNAPGLNIVVTTPSKTGPPTPISQGVSAGLLLAPIQPVYPRIAIAAHTEGTVIIHAIISKAGTIESANAVSGPIMLQGAALDAVRSARYRPYRLNGEPTEVDTTFSIVFRLSS